MLIFLIILVSIFFIFLNFHFFSYKHQHPKGHKVDIGGYKLHVLYQDKGLDVGPTVILDAGRGCNHLAWSAVQDTIPASVATLSYDRAGLGWSDASPYERTSINMVEEMRTMLIKSNIPKPYILVGHSFGGTNVLLYACLYPEDVYGIVLVDSCHEKQLEQLPRKLSGLLDNVKIQRALSYTGINKFIYAFKKEVDFNNDVDWGLYSKYVNKNNFKTFYCEYNLFNKSLEQLRMVDQEGLRSKQLSVISAGFNKDKQGEWFKAWSSLQRDLTSKSDRGIQIIDERSDHMIVKTNPQLVSDIIKEMHQSYLITDTGESI